MNLQNKEIQWLPILLIIWNLFDIAVHVAANEVEPLRITGNIIGIVAALIILLGIARTYTPYLLVIAAVTVVSLNAIQSFLHGYALPMLVFIGVSVFLLLRLAQLKPSDGTKTRFYQRWWMRLATTLIGVVIVALVGVPK